MRGTADPKQVPGSRLGLVRRSSRRHGERRNERRERCDVARARVSANLRARIVCSAAVETGGIPRLAGVAQLVEQLIRNQQVVSSSLTAGSIQINHLQRLSRVTVSRDLQPICNEGSVDCRWCLFVPPFRSRRWRRRIRFGSGNRGAFPVGVQQTHCAVQSQSRRLKVPTRRRDVGVV